MTFFHSNSLLPLLLLLLSGMSTVTFAAHIQTTKTTTGLNAATAQSTQYSPEIIDALKDIKHLIPTATIDELVAEHYLVDGHFRKAINFLRSGEFKRLLQQTEQIPEVVKILDFIHLTTNTVTRSALQQQLETTPPADMPNFIVPRIEIVLLDIAVEVGGYGGASDVAEQQQNELTLQKEHHHSFNYNLGTFTSFVEELMEHLPRDKFQQTINEHSQKSATFAAFYTALRSADFRSMVEAAMKSSDVSAILKTLNDNDIDVKDLLPIVYKVISWGP